MSRMAARREARDESGDTGGARLWLEGKRIKSGLSFRTKVCPEAKARGKSMSLNQDQICPEAKGRGHRCPGWQPGGRRETFPSRLLDVVHGFRAKVSNLALASGQKPRPDLPSSQGWGTQVPRVAARWEKGDVPLSPA